MDDQERALRGYLNSLLLAALKAGPLHGYAVLETLSERTGHPAVLSKGNVYPALHRLEHFGFISSHSSVVDGKSRRVYELTAAGREKLAADMERWREFGSAMSAVLEL